MIHKYSAHRLPLKSFYFCVSAIALMGMVGFAAISHAASTQDSQGSAQAATAIYTPVVLITGANRGLGLEFARQYKQAGYKVIATARKPAAAEELNALGVQVEQLDVTDAASVAGLANRLGDTSLDILINNAGIGGTRKSIDDVDIQAIERSFAVNTLGPMRVTQALMGNLRKGEQKIIINISSMMGSIKRNTWGIGYGYRESKAALNMFTRSLSVELKGEGFRCIVMSPGWVRTDMGGPNARLSPEESIGAMIKVINGLSPEDSGNFFSHGGEKLPW